MSSDSIIIDGVPIFYPQKTMTPEQFDYIRATLKILKAKDQVVDGAHGVIEMPSFAGRTLCLISACFSYFCSVESNLKLVYSTRTN